MSNRILRTSLTLVRVSACFAAAGRIVPITLLESHQKDREIWPPHKYRILTALARNAGGHVGGTLIAMLASWR